MKQTDEKSILLEQYKIYVEMTDKTSARRIETGRFYFAILTGIFAIMPFVVGEVDFLQIQSWIFFCIISIMAICLSVLWFINIISYRRINSAKFSVIQEMETKLAFESYKLEWEKLSGIGYIPFSIIEQSIPIITGLVSVGLLVYGISMM